MLSTTAAHQQQLHSHAYGHTNSSSRTRTPSTSRASRASRFPGRHAVIPHPRQVVADGTDSSSSPSLSASDLPPAFEPLQAAQQHQPMNYLKPDLQIPLPSRYRQLSVSTTKSDPLPQGQQASNSSHHHRNGVSPSARGSSSSRENSFSAANLSKPIIPMSNISTTTGIGDHDQGTRPQPLALPRSKTPTNIEKDSKGAAVGGWLSPLTLSPQPPAGAHAASKSTSPEHGPIHGPIDASFLTRPSSRSFRCVFIFALKNRAFCRN